MSVITQVSKLIFCRLLGMFSGEKVIPLVIGKAQRPRCFGKMRLDKLPVRYSANPKAWMNGQLFEEWLRKLNCRMARQNRHILLFLDNAPSHPTVQMSHVKLQFFPPNTTSVSQPMDAGIIQAVKLKYRRRQLSHMIIKMEVFSSMTGTELLKQISVLDAIHWVAEAWNELTPETISKCYAKCGFDDKGLEILECIEETVPLAVVKMSEELFGCGFDDLVKIDENFHT